jgi:hypothetical protein
MSTKKIIKKPRMDKSTGAVAQMRNLRNLKELLWTGQSSFQTALSSRFISAGHVVAGFCGFTHTTWR